MEEVKLFMSPPLSSQLSPLKAPPTPNFFVSLAYCYKRLSLSYWRQPGYNVVSTSNVDGVVMILVEFGGGVLTGGHTNLLTTTTVHSHLSPPVPPLGPYCLVYHRRIHHGHRLRRCGQLQCHRIDWLYCFIVHEYDLRGNAEHADVPLWWVGQPHRKKTESSGCAGDSSGSNNNRYGRDDEDDIDL